MEKLSPNSPITVVKGVSAYFAARFKNLGILTVRDLLYHFPYRYEDFSRVVPIKELQAGKTCTIRGTIVKVSQRRVWKRKMTVTEARVEDGSGKISLVWFNQDYVAKSLAEGTLMNFSGKVIARGEALQLVNPLYEPVKLETKHTARIVPVYPETRGLTSKGIRFILQPVLREALVPDILPAHIREAEGILEVNEALKKVHFPGSVGEGYAGKKRFAFEDLLLLALHIAEERARAKKETSPEIAVSVQEVKDFLELIPFELTEAQKRTLSEVVKDMSESHPMHRLIQGDVGSGKTVVAALAMLFAAERGHQSALMAPTEILARQHYRTLASLFGERGHGIGLLVAGEAKMHYGGGLETELKKDAFLREVKAGNVKMVVGTHAVIQKSVTFKNLALAAVDEQHRFGVTQRAALLRDANDANTSECHEPETDGKIVEKELSYKLNGIFYAIQDKLGRFARERQYSDELEVELKNSHIAYRREFPIEAGGRKSNFADFIIEEKILIEIKTKPFIIKEDYAQTMRYLNAGNLKLGLLVNFQQRFLKPKRVLNSRFASFASNSHRSHRYAPHFLSMSATPIPRTLSLSVFGELDLSLVDELPKDRKPIQTRVIPAEGRSAAYRGIRNQIKEGRQAFVICPRIEQITDDIQLATSDVQKLEVKSVKEEYEKLSKKIFPDLSVAMLHGKLKPKEKETIMKDFADGKTDVLVSTSVVEVGIDVPNATVMMIEGAERFGLAQLYQFRGRVGRGAHQSYCFLFTEKDDEKTRERLGYLERARNGFELAEFDLKTRGPGELFGVAQSGVPDLAMKALQNPDMLKKAKHWCDELLKEDAALEKYPLLRERLKEFAKEIHPE